jgi:hypothetical protein
MPPNKMLVYSVILLYIRENSNSICEEKYINSLKLIKEISLHISQCRLSNFIVFMDTSYLYKNYHTKLKLLI